MEEPIQAQFQPSSSSKLAQRPKKRRRVVEDNSDEDLLAPSSSSVLEDGLYCLPLITDMPLSPDIAAAIVNAQEEDEEENEEFHFT